MNIYSIELTVGLKLKNKTKNIGLEFNEIYVLTHIDESADEFFFKNETTGLHYQANSSTLEKLEFEIVQ